MAYLQEYRCPLCGTRHSLRLCRRFLAMHTTERSRFVHQIEACENCMGLSHTKKYCKSQSGCHICHSDHHTFLHPVDDSNVEWLQMTALVHIHRPGKDEDRRLARVLLDPNAKESYFLRSNQLFPYSMDECAGPTEFQLADRHDVRTLTITLRPKLVPSPYSPRRQGIPSAVLNVYDREDLSDCSFYIPCSCIIVLGQDVSHRIYLGLVETEKNLPYVQNTIFGWCFFGPIPLDQDRRYD